MKLTCVQLYSLNQDSKLHLYVILLKEIFTIQQICKFLFCLSSKTMIFERKANLKASTFEINLRVKVAVKRVI